MGHFTEGLEVGLQVKNFSNINGFLDNKISILIKNLKNLTNNSFESKLYFLGELFGFRNFDIQKIFEKYMNKNTLNKFRQDHGYKEGTYQKTWGGKEDNVHLNMIASELKEIIANEPEKYEEILYNKLKEKYEEIFASDEYRVAGKIENKHAGLQIMTPHFSEDLIFKLAKKFE
jgi:hypothetical protein